MAKTIVNLVMTFDGYIAGSHDEMDWLDKIHKRPIGGEKWDFSSFIAQIGAIIVGKRSYILGIEKGWFKNQVYGSSPIFVLTSSPPENPSQDTEFRFVSDMQEIYKQASKAAGEKAIYLFGGASVIQQFLNAGLIDELKITIAPIIIGKGIRLFDNLAEHQIELEKLDVKSHVNGMIETYYRIIK